MKSPSPPAAEQAELARDEDEKKSEEKDKSAACKIEVTVDKSEHVGDTQALRALVERIARGHMCQASGAVKLRLSLDSAGKIARVALLSVDSSIGRTLIHQLTGTKSATHAVAQGTGTVEVTITGLAQ